MINWLNTEFRHVITLLARASMQPSSIFMKNASYGSRNIENISAARPFET